MRSLLLPLGLAVCTAISAQDQGFVSGTLSMNSSTQDPDGTINDVTITEGTFGPAVGFNLAPQHVVGLAIDHTGRTEESKQNQGNMVVDVVRKRNLTTITPFYRYMKSVNEKFLLYGQAKVGFGFGKETEEINNDDTETQISTLDLRVGPGLVYIVADHWALSADWGVLGYNSLTKKYESPVGDYEVTTSGFQASLNPGAITLALNWLF